MMLFERDQTRRRLFSANSISYKKSCGNAFDEAYTSAHPSYWLKGALPVKDVTLATAVEASVAIRAQALETRLCQLDRQGATDPHAS